MNRLGEEDHGEFKALVNALGSCCCNPPAGVFFFPFLTGTAMEAASTFFSKSCYPELAIPVKLLSHHAEVVDGLDLYQNPGAYADPLWPPCRISVSQLFCCLQSMAHLPQSASNMCVCIRVPVRRASARARIFPGGCARRLQGAPRPRHARLPCTGAQGRGQLVQGVPPQQPDFGRTLATVLPLLRCWRTRWCSRDHRGLAAAVGATKRSMESSTWRRAQRTPMRGAFGWRLCGLWDAPARPRCFPQNTPLPLRPGASSCAQARRKRRVRAGFWWQSFETLLARTLALRVNMLRALQRDTATLRELLGGDKSRHW